MNTQTLDDLWRTYDRALEAAVAPDMRQHRATYLNKANSALGRLSRSVLVEAAFGIPLLIVLANYVADNIGVARYVLPALALLAMVIGQLAFSVYQLGVLSELDFAVPVLTLQKRLAVLRVRRIRVTQWTLLLSPLLWVPLLLVAIHGLLGIDPYAILNQTWLTVNVLFGVAVIPLGWWASRRLAHRFGRAPAMRRLLDDIAGRSLTDAMAYLDQLKQFEIESERD